MKGLVLLFFIIAGGGVAWQYTPRGARRDIKNWLVNNIWVIIVAFVFVAAAIVFSANTTVRFL